jgi:hypothetical protein
MRPRCRWRIGELTPYRLLVSLVETRRVAGTVRQEHIADLGAIDGHLLPSFYNGMDPTDAAKLQGLSWPRSSVWARFHFWERVDQTLARLSNRVTNPDQIKAAINARIPRPSIDEVEAVQIEGWRMLKDGFDGLIASSERSIAAWEGLIQREREHIAAFQPGVNEIAALTAKVEHQGPRGFEQLHDQANKALGQILAAKAFGGKRVFSRDK